MMYVIVGAALAVIVGAIVFKKRVRVRVCGLNVCA